MNNKIVFPNENGISIITPTGELPIEEVCLKDVPAGLPYLIIDAEDIPSSREFRNAWQADFSSPDGYGIGHDAWTAMKAEKEAKNENND